MSPRDDVLPCSACVTVVFFIGLLVGVLLVPYTVYWAWDHWDQVRRFVWR